MAIYPDPRLTDIGTCRLRGLTFDERASKQQPVPNIQHGRRSFCAKASRQTGACPYQPMTQPFLTNSQKILPSLTQLFKIPTCKSGSRTDPTVPAGRKGKSEGNRILLLTSFSHTQRGSQPTWCCTPTHLNKIHNWPSTALTVRQMNRFPAVDCQASQPDYTMWSIDDKADKTSACVIYLDYCGGGGRIMVQIMRCQHKIKLCAASGQPSGRNTIKLQLEVPGTHRRRGKITQRLTLLAGWANSPSDSTAQNGSRDRQQKEAWGETMPGENNGARMQIHGWAQRPMAELCQK
ncbi:hypothetical protein Bbelb_311640 [Branchiostoma belcheri]|nr:hypothetical protein Bbelb_311640 [Branchiostoma belcheri]